MVDLFAAYRAWMLVKVAPDQHLQHAWLSAPRMSDVAVNETGAAGHAGVRGFFGSRAIRGAPRFYNDQHNLCFTLALQGGEASCGQPLSKGMTP